MTVSSCGSLSYLSDSNTQHIGDKVNWKNGYSWLCFTFQSKKGGDWSAYVERLDYYLVANGVTDEQHAKN